MAYICDFPTLSLFSILKTLFKRNLTQEPDVENNLKYAFPPEGGKRSQVPLHSSRAQG